jgi:hypothetical protein
VPIPPPRGRYCRACKSQTKPTTTNGHATTTTKLPDEVLVPGFAGDDLRPSEVAGLLGLGLATPVTEVTPTPAPTTDPAVITIKAGLALQKFSADKKLQATLRKVLDQAGTLAKRHPKLRLELGEFYLALCDLVDEVK